MTLRSDGRRVISATMHPELYDRLRAHCTALDIPITVFVREAISRALPAADQPPNESGLASYARAVTKAREHQSSPAASQHIWAVLGSHGPRGNQ